MSTLRVDSIRGQTADGVNKYVVQVLQGELLTQTTSSSNTYADIVTQTITPKFATSKILIQCSAIGNAQGNNAVYLKLFRDTTEIGSGTGGGYYNVIGAITTPTHSSGDGFDVKGISIQYLDSPNTTSSVTYKLQFAAFNGTGKIGGRQGNTDIAVPTRITLMEIAQ